MTKYKYDWLIKQYVHEFENYLTSEIRKAIIEFIESGKSREIYYELATMLYYRKPVWFVRMIAYFLVRRAIKHTPLEPLHKIIIRKVFTDAQARVTRKQ